MVCDNLDTACFSKDRITGVVTTSNTSTVYLSHAYWTYNTLNSAPAWAKWQPNLTYTGNYAIYVWYPHFPGNVPETNSAHYMVHQSTGSDKYISPWNQAINYGSWRYLTTASCNAGTSCYVKLTDETHEASNTRRVWFDAVKFVLQAPT